MHDYTTIIGVIELTRSAMTMFRNVIELEEAESH